jgi:hypothetical protein
VKINGWVWLALFIGCLIYDYVNAKYIRAVAEYDRFKAANTSLFLVAVGGLYTYEYVNNLWNLIPIALGCWCGTFISVKQYGKSGRKVSKKQSVVNNWLLPKYHKLLKLFSRK